MELIGMARVDPTCPCTHNFSNNNNNNNNRLQDTLLTKDNQDFSSSNKILLPLQAASKTTKGLSLGTARRISCYMIITQSTLITTWWQVQDQLFILITTKPINWASTKHVLYTQMRLFPCTGVTSWRWVPIIYRHRWCPWGNSIIHKKRRCLEAKYRNSMACITSNNNINKWCSIHSKWWVVMC